MWIAAGIAGLLAVLTGLVPGSAALDAAERAWPILLFLAAITVVAELADQARVFEVAARQTAHLARGSVRRLFLGVVLLATVTTVLLSLDTTAVLLTPVVLALCLQLDLPPLPFAMATVWLANTASLLLPISNLTNLLALDHTGLSVQGWIQHMWLPALVAVLATVLVLVLLYRRQLRGSFALAAPPVVEDRVLFWLSTLVCLAVGPFFVLEVQPWIVACGAAAVLVVAFAIRRPGVLHWRLVPWNLVVLVLGLFLVVEAASSHGLDDLLSAWAGDGESLPELLRLAGVSAVAANLANNLPAYLALEPVTDGSSLRNLTVLLGTNLGPLVLIWGSLATLLWRERCKARGITVSAWRFAGAGLLCVPVVLGTSVLALWLIR